jgi:hypothetical protein
LIDLGRSYFRTSNGFCGSCACAAGAGRVVFTSNGLSPLGDAKRLHRLRRSFCKNWRNDKGRDLMLTFWFWLADGAAFIDVPMGEGAPMRLRLPPLTFDADFGIESPDDTAAMPDGEEAERPEGQADDEGSDDEPDDMDDDE